MIIRHNISSLNTSNKLKINREKTAKSLEKLSSGFKINRAGDDAAGLAISEKMRGQIRGLDMAGKNIQDGISLIQTAEGAMNEIHSLLQRGRELAVQSANDTNTFGDRLLLQKEIEQIKEGINRITNDTEFNTRKLLDGSLKYTESTTSIISPQSSIRGAGGIDHTLADGWFYFGNSGAKVKLNPGEEIKDDFSTWNFTVIQVNAYISDTDVHGLDLYTPNGWIIVTNYSGTSFTYNGVTIDVSEVTSRSGSGVTHANTPVGTFQLRVGNNDGEVSITNPEVDNRIKLQIGSNSNNNLQIDINSLSTVDLGIDSISISNNESANNSITKLDKAINIISNERAKLGAIQNSLEHIYNFVMNASENLQSSESRVRDIDMAKEMLEFTKTNILTQAAQAMLAQANQQPESILQLLQ